MLISYLDGEDLGETVLAMAGGLMELHTLNRCDSAVLALVSSLQRVNLE